MAPPAGRAWVRVVVEGDEVEWLAGAGVLEDDPQAVRLNARRIAEALARTSEEAWRVTFTRA